MSNMSYCRFENTLGDLRDCRDNLEGKLDARHEGPSRENLLLVCLQILEAVGVEMDTHQAEQAIRDFVNSEQASVETEEEETEQ